jgi:hypothetical protein
MITTEKNYRPTINPKLLTSLANHSHPGRCLLRHSLAQAFILHAAIDLHLLARLLKAFARTST